MKFINFSAFLAAAASIQGVAARTVKVVSDADDGPGSLLEALQTSVAGGTLKVVIDEDIDEINISSTLQYDGSAPLEIVGEGDMPKIVANGDFDLLATTGCTDLSIKNVAFEGLGNFSIENQGIGKGIFFDVPDDASGVVSVALEDVMVSGTAWHGVLVSDCTETDCGNGNGGTGDGSSASVSLTLQRVTVENAGKGRFDGDGVRVNERGAGSITATIDDSKFNNNGADGVELDEAGEGDVIVTVQNSEFDANGDYCFVPECDGDVESDECLEAAAALDPSCIDDGELDLDDGFDIDEADGGALLVTIIDSQASDNLDEGFDFDAEDGAVDTTFEKVTASDNFNEGIKVSSGADGDVLVTIKESTVIGNLDDGMQLESEGTGLLAVLIENTQVSGSKKADVKVEQADISTSLGALEIIGGSIDAAGVKTKNMDLN